jgi:hypothetical protein
MPLRPDL